MAGLATIDEAPDEVTVRPEWWHHPIWHRIGACLVFAVTALVTIGMRPFWLDEAFTWGIVDQPTWGDFWATTDSTAGNMLVYHAVLRPVAAVSTNEVALRLPSVVFGVVTVWFVHALALRLYSARAAAFGAVLAAVSVPLVFYSVEARSYSMVAALSAISWYLVHRGVTDDRRWQWVLLGVVVAVNGSAQAVAYLIVPALVLTVLLLRPPEWSLSGLAARLAPTGALLLVPVAITVTAPSREAEFPPPLGFGPVARAVRYLTNDHGPFSRDGIGFVISAIYLTVLGLALLALLRRRRWPNDAQVITWVWLLGVPATMVVVSLVEPVIWHRYMAGVLPATHLAAGAYLATLDRRRLAVGVVVVVAVLSLARTAIIADYGFGGFDQVADHLEANGQPGDLVVFVTPFERAGLDYEFRDGTDFVGAPPFGPYAGVDAEVGTGVADATADTLWLVDSADQGETWIDDEYGPDDFDFSEVEPLIPDRYVLVDTVYVDRYQIRRYDAG